MVGRKRKFESESVFGQMVSTALVTNNMTQTSLAESTGTSVAYTNQVITGRRPPNAEWVELATMAMKLTKQEKQKVYLAAAEDNLKRLGFDIDLTPKK
jgi:hypothetical protein